MRPSKIASSATVSAGLIRRIAYGLVLLAMLLGAVAAATAQEVIVFALRGDGTASVAVDKASKKAWITDGGKSGIQGVREARIGEEDLLSYLANIGVRDLAITCSHPHSDHMGGLEDIVVDRRILAFASILFVDSGLSKQKSIFGRFEATWKAEPSKPKATYASAEGVEAFGRSSMSGGDVSVSNFAYNASNVGKTEHDTSVIMQYKVKGNPPQTIVDFDDASPALINEWARNPKARATVVIHPHHGSRNNSIAVLLKNKTAIGLQDVVLSVNRQNRYMHPAPEVFLGLLEVLGPEHVFVTDSDIGENVRIDSAGTTDGRKPGDHLARLRSFAVAQRDRYEAKIRQSMQTGTADAAIAVTARWNAVSQESADKRKKSPIEPRLRDLLEAVLAYDKSIAILDARRDGRAWQATLFRPKRRPPPDEASGSRPEKPPEGPSGGSGEFFRKETEAKNELSSGGGPRGSGGSRFDAEIARALPRYGGIVLGNEASGPKPDAIEFVNPEPGMPDSLAQVAIRLTVKAVGTVDYVDVTNSELWAAYNLVQPSPSLRERYKQQDLQSPAVVGLSANAAGIYKVTLHPALAGTSMGWSAMYADHVVGYAHKRFELEGVGALPPAFRSFEWNGFRYDALQWFDEKSLVAVDAAAIAVKPAGESRTCSLRMRVAIKPSDSERKEFIDDMWAKAAIAALRKDYPPSKIASAMKSASLAASQLAPPGASLGEIQVLVAQLGILKLKGDEAKAKSFFKSVSDDLRKSKIDESQLWKTNAWPVAQTQAICTEYPPLAAIDRLARLTAILNLYRRTTGKSLPDLPGWVKPVWRATPDEFQVKKDPYFALLR